MRKREISDEEMNAIIKLAQRDASWSKIERETGIPRLAAKRAYETWDHNRSLEELKKVRFSIAGEEFRDHLRLLGRMIESLLIYFGSPVSAYETRSSEEVLLEWLKSFRPEDSQDITPEVIPDIPCETTVGREDRQNRRIVHDNQLLLKSLQDHTAKAVRWKTLEEWKQEWDRCVQDLGQLRKEAGEIMGNILGQEPDIVKRIVRDSGKSDAPEKLMKAVLDAVWLSIESDDMGGAPNFIRIGSYGGGYTSVMVGKSHPYTAFSFTDRDLANEVVKICRQAITILIKGDICPRLRSAVITIRYKIIELEEKLSPLKLKPVLLKTRCDLCPV